MLWVNSLKKHSLPIFLIFASITLALFGENSLSSLRYEQSSISDGEIWRLFSAHLLHLNWSHLWLNILALIIIYSLTYNYVRVSVWWYATLLSSVGITLLLYFFMSEIEWYIGLSGLLHSLIVMGSIAGIAHGRKEFYVLLIFICLKIILEQFFNPVSENIISMDANVIVNAHFYGAVMGLISSLVFRLYIIKK